MSDEMWENLEYIAEDVLASGYWFVICLDIQQAWDVCANIEAEPTDIVPEYDCPEVNYEETEEESNKRCHKMLHENVCRNHMLNYFAQMRDTQEIFEALLWGDEFR